MKDLFCFVGIIIENAQAKYTQSVEDLFCFVGIIIENAPAKYTQTCSLNFVVTKMFKLQLSRDL